MQQAIGVNYTVAAWRGIAAPKGLPADVTTKLIATIKKIADSKEWKDFAASKGYGTAWAPGPEFATFMAKGDASDGRHDEGRRRSPSGVGSPSRSRAVRRAAARRFGVLPAPARGRTLHHSMVAERIARPLDGFG